MNGNAWKEVLTIYSKEPGSETFVSTICAITFASWYMMNGGDLYELAKILGHSNIKMTGRYAKLAKQHIARTSNTAREMEVTSTNRRERGCRVNRCTRIVRARKFECFWLSVSY